MENKFWFENPTQVRAYDGIDENGEVVYFNGIAFKDNVICACCGECMKIDDLYANADEDQYTGEVITEYEYWVDFSAEIGE